MRLRRILTIREVLLAVALLAALMGGVAGYAQSYRPAQMENGSGLGRLQRQIDAIESETRAEQKETVRQIAEVKAQIAVLASEVSTITRLGWGLLTAISGLIVQALWGVIAAKRAKD